MGAIGRLHGGGEVRSTGSCGVASVSTYLAGVQTCTWKNMISDRKYYEVFLDILGMAKGVEMKIQVKIELKVSITKGRLYNTSWKKGKR